MSAPGCEADVIRSKADITSRKLSGVTARADTRLDHWYRRGYDRPCLAEKIIFWNKAEGQAGFADLPVGQPLASECRSRLAVRDPPVYDRCAPAERVLSQVDWGTPYLVAQLHGAPTAPLGRVPSCGQFK